MQQIEDESFGDAAAHGLCYACGRRIDGGDLQGKSMDTDQHQRIGNDS